MAAPWQSLVANLAVVALFISVWLHGQALFAGRAKAWRDAAFGATMGLGTVASMLLSLQIEPGIIFDLRSSLLAISGFFGGPVAAVVTLVIATFHRFLMGGAGAPVSSIGTAAAALIGIGASWLTKGRVSPLAAIGVLSVAVFAMSLLLSLVLRRHPDGAAVELALPIAITNAAATAVSGFFIMRQRSADRERDLLRAAFVQSQDLRYVKAASGRYAAANDTMAKMLGLRSHTAIVGKTDFDILDPTMAAGVVADDKQVLATGQGFDEREEIFSGADGEEGWFSTSKIPLHDSEGQIIGIGGITRDITARKRLQQEVVDSRNQLNYVLSEMSDGIAMFDRQGTLVYRNHQYCDYFPLTAAVRRSGQHIRDILTAVAETGEQKGIPEGVEAKWIDDVAATLLDTGEQEIQLFNNRWLHIRTRPTADGAALVVVSDVTKIKEAEAALVDMTVQLKLLATTDGLTGLTNRRAFDSALETEVARSRRTMQPLALLMIDVDRFKSYNDIYGHQAGDAVLRQVALCLKTSLNRPGDIVARYGGEEFVVILPGTEEDGAFFIADNFRESLRAIKIPHDGGDKAIVTASVGVAVFTERDMGADPAELVRRADEALYGAKGAGRDRVMGWRAPSEIRSVRKSGS